MNCYWLRCPDYDCYEDRRAIDFTARLDAQYEPTKNQFASKPEGLQQFRDQGWKALGKDNSDLSGLFLFRHYFESYIE